MMNRFISNTQYQRGSWLLNAILVMVVIGIVGAVVAPGLTPAYGTRLASCRSLIRGMAMALQTYCGDYDGALPSSMAVNGAKTWNKADFLKFGTKLGHFPIHSDAKRATYTEVIGDYHITRYDSFCPYDPADRDDPNADVSYWWKAAVDKAWYGEGCKKPYRKVSDYKYAADQVILYEHRNFDADEACGLTNGTEINVAFLDTHVKKVIITNATSGDPVNCAANSDGQPMYSNYDYTAKKGLASDKTPAKFIDPARYGDKFGTHARPTRPTRVDPWRTKTEMSLGWVTAGACAAGLVALVGVGRIVIRRVGQARG